MDPAGIWLGIAIAAMATILVGGVLAGTLNDLAKVYREYSERGRVLKGENVVTAAVGLLCTWLLSLGLSALVFGLIDYFDQVLLGVVVATFATVPLFFVLLRVTIKLRWGWARFQHPFWGFKITNSDRPRFADM